MRGTMGPEEVKGLQKCLSRWVLREGRKGGGAYKSVDVGVDGQVVDGDTKKLDVSFFFAVYGFIGMNDWLTDWAWCCLFVWSM